MKKIITSCAAAALLSAPVHAERLPMPEQFFYFGGHASQTFIDLLDHKYVDDIDNPTLPGAQLGYRFNRHWSAQAWWERNSFTTDSGAIDGDLSMTIASARYHFADHVLIGFEPYLGIAVADMEIDTGDSRNETLGGAGLGLQRRLRPHWILDLGGRTFYSFDDERFDGEAYIALNYVIGAADNRADASDTVAPVTAPAPVDTDGDGVADSVDQCPQTVAGAVVNDSGCELDSDGDKVSDSQDQCADTPTGARVDEVGCRVKLTSALKQTFYFNFASGTAELSADSNAEVERLAALLREYPDSHVTLEGHTDSQGAEALNLTLSEQRASAVRQALIDSQGLEATRVSAIGKGEAEPVGDNSTAEGRASNRRVEVILDAASN